MSEQVIEEWSDMPLDSRITEALHDLKWVKPTTVQSACVPLALKGKDIAIQSRTGSGKTGAFVIPIIQHLLNMRERRRGNTFSAANTAQRKLASVASVQNPNALILVPSVELCEQTVEITELIAKYVKPRFVIDNLTSNLGGSHFVEDAHDTSNSNNSNSSSNNNSNSSLMARMQSAHIVVSTAALLARHIRNGALPTSIFSHIRYLVMDEADMLLAVAEHAIRVIQSALPTQAMQVILCSATLTDGVAAVKGQLLHNPVNVILSTTVESETGNATKSSNNNNNNDSNNNSNNKKKNINKDTQDEEKQHSEKSTLTSGIMTKSQSQSAITPIVESRIILRDRDVKTLKQYYLIATDECHKHTLLFALYRFSLLHGKTLIFVNEEDDTYKLQHFLEQLGIATLVYDASLPVNVRLDTLRQFQRGNVSTLVCTDGTLESAEQLQLSLSEERSSTNIIGEEEIDSSIAQQRGMNAKRNACNDNDSDEDGLSSTRYCNKNNNKGNKLGQKRSRTELHMLRKNHNCKNNSNNGELPSALHRGVDFAKVNNVILFDGVEASSPLALSRYTHRIGRVGRAGVKGTAITLFNLPQAKKYTRLLQIYCRSRGDALAPFRPLHRQEAAKLQYRVDSVLMNVTRTSTRKLRVATVAAELGKSSYLTHHLSSKDNEVLQRVVRRSAKRVKVEREMLQIPEYMNIQHADDVHTYTRRVQANQTRARNFKEAIRQSSNKNGISRKISKKMVAAKRGKVGRKVTAANKAKNANNTRTKEKRNQNQISSKNNNHIPSVNVDPLQAMASRLRASRSRK